MGSGSGCSIWASWTADATARLFCGQTKREVRQKLDKLRAARDRGMDLLAPSSTVGRWLDAWLSEIKAFDGTRPRTLELYKGLAKRYVKPRPGPSPSSAIQICC